MDWRFDVLPGGELVREGLNDIQHGRRTTASLLVLIGSPRLNALGFNVPTDEENPEHALYDLLASEEEDSAHSRYNALVRALVSFERAAECVAK